VLDLLKAASDAFSSQKFQSGMTRAFVKVGLLPRTTTGAALYQMYPHEHPSSYGKWVEDLQVTEFTPTDQVFFIDELFDELALISFESADEQARSEAAFWNSEAVESTGTNSDDNETDCDR